MKSITLMLKIVHRLSFIVSNLVLQWRAKENLTTRLWILIIYFIFFHDFIWFIWLQLNFILFVTFSNNIPNSVSRWHLNTVPYLNIIPFSRIFRHLASTILLLSLPFNRVSKDLQPLSNDIIENYLWQRRWICEQTRIGMASRSSGS